MTDTWELPPYELYAPWDPNIDHTPPPLTSVDGPAQPVLKIPVAGPSPFNTLAVVRGRAFIGSGPISDGTMHRVDSVVRTHLVIPEFDRDVPLGNQLAHSTTASILAMASGPEKEVFADDGSHFTIAIDEVVADPHVDPDTGRYSVTVRTACEHHQTSTAQWLEMTSWVLYREPEQVAPGGPSPRRLILRRPR
ncbi:hypothetical protein [Xylanimonas protaetiae]|uniref:Uncharacterized protein n=1 Tax=Xylanimonas protaetiae TaxID=2509457 RepID=A0A4P6FG44_9MICO|nr:hypothetical protein [Xylanimonas protaetiae]QAY69558.1 hypothetical protein ET471_05460 [Xylanimonas protaetiae]